MDRKINKTKNKDYIIGISIIILLLFIMIIFGIYYNTDNTRTQSTTSDITTIEKEDKTYKRFYTDFLGKTEEYLISNWGKPHYDYDKIIPSALYIDDPLEKIGETGLEQFYNGIENTSWYQFEFDVKQKIIVVIKKRAFLSFDKAKEGREWLKDELKENSKYQYFRGYEILYSGEKFGTIKLFENPYAPGYIVQVAISYYSMEELERLGSGESGPNF